MSYCTMAVCLAHRRHCYYNLIEGRWVHHDGWPCEAIADCPVPGKWPDL